MTHHLFVYYSKQYIPSSPVGTFFKNLSIIYRCSRSFGRPLGFRLEISWLLFYIPGRGDIRRFLGNPCVRSAYIYQSRDGTIYLSRHCRLSVPQCTLWIPPSGSSRLFQVRKTHISHLLALFHALICMHVYQLPLHRRIVEFFLNVTEVTIGVCQISVLVFFFLLEFISFIILGGSDIFMNDMEL